MGKDYTIRLETSLVKAVDLPKPKEDEEVMATYGEAKENIEERREAKLVVFEMKEVESSNIHSIGYNKDFEQLRIIFTNGGLYQYKGIKPEVYEEMMKSESVGSYFSKNIRNKCECVKLT